MRMLLTCILPQMGLLGCRLLAVRACYTHIMVVQHHAVHLKVNDERSSGAMCGPGGVHLSRDSESMA